MSCLSVILSNSVVSWEELGMAGRVVVTAKMETCWHSVGGAEEIDITVVGM
jgi:hypothetical protein